MDHKLPRFAFLLGLTGLIPQMLAAAISLHPPHAAFGQFAGFLYAGLILSFIGGTWWGIAAVHRGALRWLYALSVVPSLIAFAAGLSWVARGGSPGPSLLIVAFALLVAPIVDWGLTQRRLAPTGWLTMRAVLSVGLGSLTLLIMRSA